MNIACLTGRLTADPELKTTPSGVSVTSFTIAVDRKYKTKDGEKVTDFLQIVAWRETAEFINKWFGKGMKIEVSGEIQSRKYKDKDGNNRVAVEIVANEVGFAESKQSSPAVNTERSEPAESAMPDDLPF